MPIIVATAVACSVLLAAFIFTLRRSPAALPEVLRESSANATTSDALPIDSGGTDLDLHQGANRLLAAVNPELPENRYLPVYTKEKLRWMVKQHAAGRLTVAFLEDTARLTLPGDVFMAASQLDGQPTIFVVKERFASFLREGTGPDASVDQRQKNDFALALVHEIVHLQNPGANPRDPAALLREESRAWREVTLNVIRPLQARNQPMDSRFLEVDAALRLCADQLPCPPLGRVVRLTR